MGQKESKDTLSKHDLEFLSATPEVLFGRLVITLGGTICEDMHRYNRTAVLFSRYQSQEKQLEQAAHGFGCPHKDIH